MMYRVVDYHKADVQAALDTHRDLVNGLGGSDDATTGRPTPNWWHDFSEKVKDASRPAAERKMQHLAPIELPQITLNFQFGC